MSSPAASGDPAAEITDRVGRILHALLPDEAVRIRAVGDVGDEWARTTIEFDDGTGVFRALALDRLPVCDARSITGDMMALHRLMDDYEPWDSFVITVDRSGCVTVDYDSEGR
ncbi:hypothetical protein [Nocardia sp. XZ_19_385]|uniref:hypothetical protein n=1 Tax=Nocardia sp. XZ_19_385 TaxID=2769488 RepID=UPI0018909F5E|nr:hypothetical protein [Nocardia sp. XZ_19_385]